LSAIREQRIGIIGNGSWGTALAKILTGNGHLINWWIRNEESVTFLKKRLHNPQYLTTVHFDSSLIRPSSNLHEVLEQVDIVIFAVPSAFAIHVIQSVDQDLWQGKIFVSAIKGILPDADQLLNDYLEAQMNFDRLSYVALTGPCHAEEVAQERLSYLTFSCLTERLASEISALFSCSYISTTYNTDIWGVQYAAVLKNIYALGAGIAHGLDYGDNFLSVYTSACYREMYFFLKSHYLAFKQYQAEKPDFHASAYLGDLLVTAYSVHSRNRMFGNMLGKGYAVKNAILEMNMVAEGYYASRGMKHIADSLKLNMPLASCIYEILWDGQPAKEIFRRLEKILF
jgi:glycerol-3-phosphate dehydrogenase (NAD(P)+)